MRLKNLSLLGVVLILLIFSVSIVSANVCTYTNDEGRWNTGKRGTVYVENWGNLWRGASWTDYCDGDYLHEQECDGVIHLNSGYDCMFGCYNGACRAGFIKSLNYVKNSPSSISMIIGSKYPAYEQLSNTQFVYCIRLGKDNWDESATLNWPSNPGYCDFEGSFENTLSPPGDYDWDEDGSNEIIMTKLISNSGFTGETWYSIGVLSSNPTSGYGEWVQEDYINIQTSDCPTCADPETVSCGATIPDTPGCDACTEVGRLCPSGFYCTWNTDLFGGWGCASWACTVNTEHSYLKCYNGDVYWYDNCNDRDDKYQDCGTGTCSTSGTDHCVACVPTITCPSANAVPCGQDGGTNGCTSCGITGTQCTTGTCTAGVCSCTPDLSCAANTCIGSTCTDPVCGDTVDGAKDCPSCPDGTCNGDETCSSCPADCGVCECEITDGWWDVNMASEGTVVGINVTGNSYCDGETVSFEVREEDLNLWISSNPVDTEPLSSVFSGTKANTTWVAEWHDDLGGPEYWFRATVSTDEFTSSSSIENQLNVSEDEPCSGIQVCNNYSDALTCGEDDCNKSASNAELIAPGIDCAGEDDTCECYWDTTAGSCKINAIDVTISSDGSSGSCSYKELLGNTDCDGTNEFITYSWIADWNGDADAEGFERCIAGSNIIQCPAEIKLPFFGWMQTIAVLVLIVLGYKYLIIKKGKKRKSSKDDSGEPKKKQKK